MIDNPLCLKSYLKLKMSNSNQKSKIFFTLDFRFFTRLPSRDYMFLKKFDHILLTIVTKKTEKLVQKG